MYLTGQFGEFDFLPWRTMLRRSVTKAKKLIGLKECNAGLRALPACHEKRLLRKRFTGRHARSLDGRVETLRRTR